MTVKMLVFSERRVGMALGNPTEADVFRAAGMALAAVPAGAGDGRDDRDGSHRDLMRAMEACQRRIEEVLRRLDVLEARGALVREVLRGSFVASRL